VADPQDAEIAARVASTVELWAKIAGSLLIVGGFVKGIVKPFILWRREHQAKVIRDVLAPELAALNRVITQEDGCASRMEVVLVKLRELFGDHDGLIALAYDSRERLDEQNDLLSAIGLSSDRRHDPERRELLDEVIHQLMERRKSRRRMIDDPLNDPLHTPHQFPKQEL
jgi:hypothetical protein